MPEMPLIYQSIVKVMEEVGCVGKNQRNLQQGFMFRGIDAVMNAIYPALVKNKVFIVPEVLEQEREERKTKSGTNMIYSVCKIRYTFFAADGSSISAIVVGEGMDTGDKATNKAMATAFKYACFQVFCIPTEEMKDPDSETPEPSVKKNSAPEMPKTSIKNTSATSLDETKLDRNSSKSRNYELEQVLKKNAIKLQTIFILYQVNSLEELSEEKYQNIVNHLKEIKKYQRDREKINELEKVLKEKGIKPQTIYVLYRVNSLKELSEEKYRNIMEHMEDIRAHQDQNY